MVEPTAYAAAGSAASALIWVTVGVKLFRRRVDAEHKNAARAFAASWFGIGGVSAIASAATFATLAGAWSPRVPLIAAWMTLPLGYLAVAGFTAYVAHIMTGRRDAVPTALAGYGALFLIIVLVLIQLAPASAYATGWSVRFVFVNAGPNANAALAVLLLLPATIAAIPYVALLARASTPTARWRIVLVGGGIGAWLLTALIARGPFMTDAAIGVARALGALAAVAVLLAYAPPRAVRERWGVASLTDERAGVIVDHARVHTRHAQLERRARDLI